MTLPRGSIYKLCGLLLWLIGAIAASVWMAVHEEWILMSFCLIVGVVAVVKIIRFHFQNIRKLTYLFDSIENGDYAFKFTEYDGSFQRQYAEHVVESHQGYFGACPYGDHPT